MEIEKVDDLDLLTACILGEAAGEPFVGKLAIACVVRNRLEDPDRWNFTTEDDRLPWREVILQPKQFSCFNHLPREGEIPTTLVHRMFLTYRSERWWREARFAAWGVLHDYYGDITNGANHYVNPKLIDKPPYWIGDNQPCFKVGVHEFYNI